jgi:hypothetical protein
MYEVLKKLLAKLDKLSFDELFYIKKISSFIVNALIGVKIYIVYLVYKIKFYK